MQYHSHPDFHRREFMLTGHIPRLAHPHDGLAAMLASARPEMELAS